MYTERKLNTIPHGQVKVRAYDCGTVELISYATTVARLEQNDGWLEVYGLYSATTRKHLSAFMREYCNCDYSVAKRCATTGEWYNIYDRTFSRVY